METRIGQKLENFFSQHKHQLYKKGEILIRADDEPAGVFYLKTGIVKEYTISKKGEELVINIFKPQSFFPMSWAVNNSKNMYYYEAITDSEVWRSPRDTTLTFIKQNPDVLYDLLKRVYIGLDGLLLRMVYLMSENAQDRLLTELVIQGKRFGRKLADNAIELKITEKDLASQSGMTRETVSRVIKVLKDKNLITFQKGVLHILDIKLLESELDGIH